MVYGILDILDQPNVGDWKYRYNHNNWHHRYGVRIGNWKFMNFRHGSFLRMCQTGFKNDQLFEKYANARGQTMENFREKYMAKLEKCGQNCGDYTDSK